MAVELGGVEPVAGARLLGGVHRDVGAAQQRSRVIAVVREARDPEAGPDLQDHLLDGKRPLHLVDQRDRDPVQAVGVVGPLAREHGELVAAEPRHEPVGPTVRASRGPSSRSS